MSQGTGQSSSLDSIVKANFDRVESPREVLIQAIETDSWQFTPDRRFWSNLNGVGIACGQRAEYARRALAYLSHSFDQYGFSPGALHDLRRFGRWADTPEHSLEIAKLESAHVGAFKAIEAAVGDPGGQPNPRKQLRLSTELQRIGLSPTLNCGFRDTKTLSDRIWEIASDRDKRSAHGCTPRQRVINFGELVDCQEVSRILVRAFVESLTAAVTTTAMRSPIPKRVPRRLKKQPLRRAPKKPTAVHS